MTILTVGGDLEFSVAKIDKESHPIPERFQGTAVQLATMIDAARNLRNAGTYRILGTVELRTAGDYCTIVYDTGIVYSFSLSVSHSAVEAYRRK